MAKRKGVAASIARYQREVASAQAAQIRLQSAAAREAQRAQRAYERAAQGDEKERKRLYLESRAADVDSRNEDLDAAILALESILEQTIDHDDRIDFKTLKLAAEVAPFQPGPLAINGVPPSPSEFQVPPVLGARSLIPGAKKKQQEQQAEMTFRFNTAMADHQQREQDRLSKLATYRAQIDQWNANAARKAQLQNDEIEAFRLEFESGDPDAILSYFDLVLSRSSYPEGFPTNHRIAFVPESKQLVVECEFPGVNAIPDVKAYRYVKTKDEVTSTPRAVAQIRSLYSSAISQVTIRKLHELFEADTHGFLETIVLNGYVDTVDPRTGQQAKPMLVTVRTTRAVFEGIDLRRVDPIACLQHLGASVSKSPAELSPVRPVLEFDMVDKRFVEEGDILSGLDQRPNLMELTPSEFETLITNLFTKMGLEARLTQASRDGGVDCVAFDPRPVFGGKVVIQAKRYKGTVGVSAVRDLFGTVHNEGASKGILVTTSGYGAASHQFANGKPLELIDGAGLLYLLSEHAGIEAKIVPPDEWVDPTLAP